jgi:proliferating cell nuclear antigen PCNA
MDSSRVSIFELILPAEWFDIYDFEQSGPFTIGVNSIMLFKILNTRDKTQETYIIYDNDTDTDKLFIQFTSDNKTIYDKNFELPLIDIDAELMDIPTADCDAEFSISSSSFANIISQLRIFGDSIDIECSEDKIELHSISPESGKMMVNIDIDELTSYAINEDEIIKLSFSLAILQNICLYHKLSKEMVIYLTADFPLKLVYLLDTDNKASMTFFLAPKINEDE